MKYALLFLMLTTAACSVTSDTNTTSTKDDIGVQSSVEIGTIIAIDEVKVDGESTGLGTLAGGGLGAVGGSMIGGGSRAQTAAGIVGGVIGIIAGRSAEKKITSGTSSRFLVRKDNGTTVSVLQSNELGFKVGDRVMLLKGRDTKLQKYNGI